MFVSDKLRVIDGTELIKVAFIVLVVVINAFFCLSTVHPPRKKIAILSPTVCEWFLVRRNCKPWGLEKIQAV